MNVKSRFWIRDVEGVNVDMFEAGNGEVRLFVNGELVSSLNFRRLLIAAFVTHRDDQSRGIGRGSDEFGGGVDYWRGWDERDSIGNGLTDGEHDFVEDGDDVGDSGG